jgi:serine/threonine protein kinase/tetratricopeptide (TPR) repeat protein
MATTTDLHERALRWQQLRAEGREATAEELCADRPELVPELRRLIDKVQAMNDLLGLDGPGPAPPPPPGAPALPGYDILGVLGEGGMGVVYRARERDGGRTVALKMMRRPEPAALERFKKEFRTLQGLSHPNLVTLYDLVSDGKQWLLTMDLVEGRPFPGDLVPSYQGPTDVTVDAVSDSGLGGGAVPFGPGSLAVAAPPPPSDRLRDALRQLAEGIGTLHEHGVLHRDIKPSNVLVSPEGRVVMLDFGLAAEAAAEPDRSQAGAGTLLYMAPEQVNGRPEPASDWYSFGVMLYEALTGWHPFEGTPHELPWNRPADGPPPPHTNWPAIPEDLSRLCAALLRAGPADRPAGAEVRRRLAGSDAAAPPPAVPPAPPFLGRDAELAGLARALDDVRQGQTVTVLLHGASGVGKSALAQHFLDGLRRQAAGAVVLAGRCYERESVPYKALDGLVDALGRYWRHLPRDQARELLPRDVGPLVRVFPVLLRVEAVAEAPRREAPDPHEVRRRAFAALREVLGRLGDRRPLVLHLDDLQWGDVDSALMLAELVRPPEPPRLLLVAGFRSEDRERSPCLRALWRALEAGPGPDRREVALRPLGPDDARELAARLLAGAGAGAAEAVARESGGSPFFIVELAQAVQAGGADVTLGGAIAARVGALLAEQRRLLEVVAVAGRPLGHNAALRAAGLGEDGRRCLIELQAARLLRGGPTGRQEVEAYHDRIRETVVARLDAKALAEHHRRLARTLEATGRADPEVLAVHLDGAGEPQRAGEYYARAAEQAARALAFDRAAHLFRRALELSRPGPAEASALQVRLGDALANAGRGAEAAPAYLAAVPHAAPGLALELQRRAAEQYLRSGRIDEGLAHLRTVLARVGMSLPETPLRALLMLLRGRLRLWWRGTKFHERPAEQVPPEEVTRIDVCWSAASVLSLVDTIRGLAFLARHSLLALRAGEPRRVAQALATEAVYHAVAGAAGAARAEALLRSAADLAARADSPYHRTMVDVSEGAVAVLLGRWRQALDVTARAQKALREQCTGVAWEIGTNYHYRFTAMENAGQFRQCARELPAGLREARERGDRFTATSLLIHSAALELAAGRPDDARRTVAEALGQWSVAGFHIQHYHALFVRLMIERYAGNAGAAWEMVCRDWPALRRSLLLRLQHVRIVMHQFRGLCALGLAAARDAHAAVLVRSARGDARRLEREGTAWADAAAKLVRAGLAVQVGQRGEAVTRFEAAESAFRAVDMPLFAAAARRRRGQLFGGESGRSLVAEADRALADEDVRDPARMADALAPGVADPG